MTDPFVTIPPEERENFKNFYTTYTKLIALSYLEQGEIEYHKERFRKLLYLLREGLYESAKKEMSEMLTELQAKRNISG